MTPPFPPPEHAARTNVVPPDMPIKGAPRSKHQDRPDGSENAFVGLYNGQARTHPPPSPKKGHEPGDAVAVARGGVAARMAVDGLRGFDEKAPATGDTGPSAHRLATVAQPPVGQPEQVLDGGRSDRPPMGRIKIAPDQKGSAKSAFRADGSGEVTDNANAGGANHRTQAVGNHLSAGSGADALRLQQNVAAMQHPAATARRPSGKTAPNSAVIGRVTAKNLVHPPQKGDSAANIAEAGATGRPLPKAARADGGGMLPPVHRPERKAAGVQKSMTEARDQPSPTVANGTTQNGGQPDAMGDTGLPVQHFEVGAAALQPPAAAGQASPIQGVTGPVLAQPLATQIAQSIITENGHVTEIALHPAELGKVRLRLHTSDRGVQLHIVAERADTAGLLRRHVGDLATEFESLGYDNIGFSFSDSGQQSGAEQSFSSDTAPPDQIGELAGNTVSPAVTTPLTHIEGGLDLRL